MSSKTLLTLAFLIPATSALAQGQALSPETISPEADLAMWCGAAFSVLSQASRTGGDTAKADAENTKSTALFTKAATELMRNGATEAEFTGLAQQYAGIVMSPFRAPEQSRTEAECNAAAAAP